MSEIPFDRSEPQFFVRVTGESGEARVLVTNAGGDGEPLPDGVSRVMSFEYKDDERRADTLKLTINNEDLSNFDDPAWKKGNRMTVRWGYPGRMAPARQLIITKVTGFRQLTIEARAESVLMNRIIKCRLFENKKISTVVAEVASENGFSAEVQDIDDTEVVMPSIQQARLTDAQFLRRMANREGFEFYVDFDGFHFHRRRVEQRPVRRYRYYTDPSVGEIVNITIENDITAKPARVRVRSRNPMEGEDNDSTADTSGGGELTQVLDFDEEAGRTRVVFRDSQGRRFATRDDAAKAREEGSEPMLVRNQLTSVLELLDRGSARSDTEANAAQETTEPNSETDGSAVRREANARQRRHQQTAIKMKMDVVGDPLQFAKTVIQLEGVGQRLSVRYWVKSVTHKLGPGYMMNLECVSDGHGGHSVTSRAARGIELIDAGPAQRGRRNRQNGPEGGETDGETDELTQVLDFDEETGRTRVVYRDSQGRRFATEADAAKAREAAAGTAVEET